MSSVPREFDGALGACGKVLAGHVRGKVIVEIASTIFLWYGW